MRGWPIATLLGCVSACSLVTDLSGLTSNDAVPSDGGSGSDSAVARDGGGDGNVGEADGSVTSDAGTPALPRLVQNASATLGTAKLALTTTFAPTVEGDLIVAAVTINSNAAASVLSITDNAPGGSNTYVTAGQRSTDTSCDDVAEIWYAKDIRAGATSLTVVSSTAVRMDVWALELSGLDRMNPLDKGATTSNQGLSTVVTAPSVPATNNAVVISTACTCGNISGVKAGNPFIALNVQTGENAAYLITSTAGTFGAAWSSTNDTWNASTVSFR
ncbi:MAG: hypothetical protein JWM74_3860 [Myxococcaceae bacterium]|nr:hypothetical protein [Myxococcaceae bacterium]